MRGKLKAREKEREGGKLKGKKLPSRPGTPSNPGSPASPSRPSNPGSPDFF